MSDSNIVPFSRNQPLTATNTAIRFEDVVVNRGTKQLLDGLDLSVSDSGVTALLGPNGAGKSLIIRLISGLMEADSGTIRLDAEMAANLSVVFQSPVVLRRSVRANLDHALKMYGVPKKQRMGRIAELLVMADLTAQAETPARALSGGEKQRLAMARSLAARPKLLLLDEPTASLDPHAAAAIELLTRRAAREGMKIILVTHDWAQAQRLADDVIFLNRGRVTEHTDAAVFFERPLSNEGRTYLAGRILL